jgi:cell division protein FtsB
MNKKTVEEEKKLSNWLSRIDREVFNTFRTFIEKSKWDLKVEMDKLLDDNMKLEKKIEDLNDEIKRLKRRAKTK